jgi:hypothetical protein
MSSQQRRAIEAERSAESRIDLAIDRAVREMLDVDPPADLRARVVARSEALDRRSVPLPTAGARGARRTELFWIAAPIAAATILILAVMPPWRVEPVQPSRPAHADVNLPLMTPSRPGTRRAPAPATVAAHREHAAAAVRTVEQDATPIDATRRIEPLRPITPIDVAVIRPPSIAPRDISVAPLAPIAQVEISPLFPPEKRD